MLGLGLAVATHVKEASSGWTTVRSSGASVMLGATIKQNTVEYCHRGGIKLTFYI